MTGWRLWMPDLLHALDRIATALERIADQGDNHLRQEPPNGPNDRNPSQTP